MVSNRSNISFDIYCNGDSSCYGITIYGADKLFCHAPESCSWSNISSCNKRYNRDRDAQIMVYEECLL